MPFVAEGNYHIASMKGHGVWVPAFAGTTTDRFSGPALLRRACIRSPTYLHPRIPQQHRRRFLCRARHRRIVADEVLRDRTVDEQGKLRRQCIRVRDAELHQQTAKPEAAAFLEGDGNFSNRPVLAEFGNRIDKGAAAKILRRKAPLQRIEGAENLLDWR